MIRHQGHRRHRMTEWDELLAKYPDDVRAMATETRRVIRAALPGAIEEVDSKANVVGYGLGAGYSNLICTIILSKTGVKLGLVGGASLPDPKKLLTGTGKVHRYVQITDPADARRPAVKALLKAGVAAWKIKSG